MNGERTVTPFINDKPYPISIEMRPLWRICLIIISIAVVSGEKKYLDAKKTNILVWMLIRRNKWDEYESYISGREKNIPLVSIDTATYKAVEFSIVKGFVRIDGGRLHLTNHGEKLFSALIENNIMEDEMNFLGKFGRRLSDNKVKGLTGGLL